MWSFKVWNDSRNIGPTQKINIKPNGRLVKVIREPAFGFYNLNFFYGVVKFLKKYQLGLLFYKYIRV